MQQQGNSLPVFSGDTNNIKPNDGCKIPTCWFACVLQSATFSEGFYILLMTIKSQEKCWSWREPTTARRKPKLASSETLKLKTWWSVPLAPCGRLWHFDSIENCYQTQQWSLWWWWRWRCQLPWQRWPNAPSTERRPPRTHPPPEPACRWWTLSASLQKGTEREREKNISWVQTWETGSARNAERIVSLAGARQSKGQHF